MNQPWTSLRITQALRKLHKGGADLSYNAMARKQQALVSAAAYHHGSYRQAIIKAGIDYALVTRRPRWTKELIIQLIKKARRAGQDLNWASVSTGKDELHRAAFASLQPRLFGSWNAALEAAGLKLAQVSRYRAWSKPALIGELRRLAKDRSPLNSGAIQKSQPSLHAAAIRYFGSYDSALKAAGLDPAQLRQRRRWSKTLVITELRAFSRKNRGLVDQQLRKQSPPLYGAALRFFSSLTEARKAM